jgi:hypothetical protein
MHRTVRLEAAVATNGMSSHASWSPIPWEFEILILFLEWLRVEIHKEAYQDYIKRAKKRAQAMRQIQAGTEETWALYLPVWMNVVASMELLAVSDRDANWLEWVLKRTSEHICCVACGMSSMIL